MFYWNRFAEKQDCEINVARIEQFRDAALLEMKRAERYRNFLSLLVLNLSEFLATAGKRKIDSPEKSEAFVKEAAERLARFVRETDLVSILQDDQLVMLLPETDINGARLAADRFRDILSEFMGEYLESNYRFNVPGEITSFPDPTGEASLKMKLSSLFGNN